MLLLLDLSDVMSHDQRSQFGRLMRDAIIGIATSSGAIDQLQPVIDRAEQEGAFVTEYELLVREIFDHVKGQPDPQPALLEFVTKRFGRLDDDRRAALIVQAGNWLTQQPHRRVSLSEELGRIDDLKPREREQLVEMIIEAERLETEPNTRVPMLKAAQAMAGSRTTRARRRLQERIDALEKGSEADLVVWRSMSTESV